METLLLSLHYPVIIAWFIVCISLALMLRLFSFLFFPFMVAWFYRKMDWVEPFSKYCFKKEVVYNKKSKHLCQK